MILLCVGLDLHREVDENCALLCDYAVSIGKYLPTFRDKLSGLFQGKTVA
jgi:hypothetical protein